MYRNSVGKWPISVTPPNFVELEIVDTDPGLKGDTAGTTAANRSPVYWRCG